MTSGSTHQVSSVEEGLVFGDWTKGIAGGFGTEENDWFNTGPPLDIDLLPGQLATSWSFPDYQTFVFQIRQGVHFHNRPPVNGREMTVDDVIWNINRMFTVPTSPALRSAPGGEIPTSVEKTGPWEITIKVPSLEYSNALWRMITISAYVLIIPPEVVEQYGDMTDWRNVIGTGPYMVEEDVAGSYTTLVRNPDFWEKNPIGPGKGDQLPYPDKQTWLNIEDASTRVASMRTYKIDFFEDFVWEEQESLIATNPQLGYSWCPYSAPSTIYFQMNNPLFQDKRVRKALNLAIDKQAIVDSIWGGNAVLMSAPTQDFQDIKDTFIPMNQLPPESQEFYQYDPVKAKQLLSEAGYPDGFKVSMDALPREDDVLAVIQSQWESNLNVDLELNVKEWGVARSIAVGHTFPDLLWMYGSGWAPFILRDFRPNIGNYGEVNDPKINAAYSTIQNNAWDYEVAAKAYRDILPYILDQQYIIATPAKMRCKMWSPWLQNFSGENGLGARLLIGGPMRYAWVDSELKTAMGY